MRAAARALAAGLAAAALAAAPGTAQAQVTSATAQCWSCNAMLYGMRFAEALSGTAVDQVAGVAWPFFAAVVGITMTYRIGIAVATGTSWVPDFVQSMVRFVVLAAMFTSASGVSSMVTGLAVLPALQAGAGLGNALSQTGTAALGISIPASACPSMTPAQAGIQGAGFVAAANSLLPMACRVNQTTMAAYQVGDVMASQQLRSGTSTDQRFALFYGAVGAVVMLTALTSLLDFALSLFECIVRLAAFAAFSPFTLFFWLYKPLRGAVRRSLSQVMYTFVYMSMVGLSTVVSVFLLYNGMALGLGMTTSPLPSTADIISKFLDSITQGTTINAIQTWGTAITFAGFTLISTMVSMSLTKSINRLAMELTDPSLGGDANRTFAGAVTNAMGTMVSLGVGSAGAGGIALGRLASTFVGKQTGIRVRRG